MKLKAAAILLAASMVLGLTGCVSVPPADGAPQSSVPQAESLPEQPEPETSGRGGFIQMQDTLSNPDLKPAVAPYQAEVDFSNVINAEDFSYLLQNDENKRLLLENGFVVPGSGGSEFYQIYESNRYSLIPNFVTTDAMMHTYHLFFSRLLKGVETEHFYQELISVSQIMQEASLAQYKLLAGTEWENAAKRNTAFFTVGLSLLQDGVETPAEVRDAVGQELALIGSASGIADSPVMNLGGKNPIPLQEDYSQYIPRGYYTASEELTRYFKAMMWYGRLSFRQSDEDQSRSALLMTLDLENGAAKEAWEKIYTVTSFFVGASDDLGIYEYAPLITEAYGALPSAEELPGKTAQWKAFLEAASKLAPPAVNSIPIYDKELQPDQEAAVKAFRFMGQRTTLDAAVFQKLIYRAVAENSAGERRMLPSALDIPSVLGSAAAQEILAGGGAEDYAGYTENRDAIRDYLSGAPDTVWNGSLYGGWLNTLRPLLTVKGEGYPPFMQSRAWTLKNLNTFLGSWTELKHDSILYAKQSYAEMGGGGWEERDDRGYVEPEPQLYGRLSALAQATSDGLRSFGLLREADAESLRLLTELSQKLLVISEKELADQPLDDGEYELIRSFGGQLEHFWNEAAAASIGLEDAMGQNYPAALIADVATDPNGSVLEVGTGYIDRICVIVKVDGTLRIAEGGIYSFYEFEQPLSDRLTDEKWRQMLGIDMQIDENGERIDARVDVPHPDWTSAFRADDNR